ncbi:MAG TPA: NAD-dependent epimerase/dehydratase family protein [Anaeromyxobacteraceae bacterium]|nr:NAD-dependent epimerase/dehydratase family protein [Anaeromyxobacteraceae bacterium]
MRVLVTGGNGSVGRDLVPALVAAGHEVVVLDRELGALEPLPRKRLQLVKGGVEDRSAVEEAIGGAQAVIHLAWSFSDDPAVLLDRDLKGHQLLLQAARARGVRHFVYTSSAVVYGKPLQIPIAEDHPLRVLEARKPAYAIAKETAEKLTQLAAATGGPPGTVLRFWWSFGEAIAGRHLRDMLAAAAAGDRLRVPVECGGSFLTAEDLTAAVQAILEPRASFETFNLASAYVTWEEVARMALEVTGSSASVDLVPASAFTGPAFLADPWQLDDRRLRAAAGWAPRRGPAEVRGLLERAIARTWERARAQAARP